MNSSLILIGPGYLTWNSANFRFGAGGYKLKFLKNNRPVTAEEFGDIDSVETDRRVVISGRIWSSIDNLSLMLPAAAFLPVIGGKLFGTANLAATAFGADGSKCIVPNAQLTKMANMMLAVEKDIWSADVELTGLLLSGGNPQTATDYYTYTIGNSYSAPAFSKSNFRAPVLSAGWAGTLTNSGTSFAAFAFRKGAALDWKWDLDFEPCYVDGYGTLDAVVQGFSASCKGTPIGVIEADAASALLPAQALGVLESVNGGDLTLTYGANSVVLKQAYVAENDGFSWSRKNNRIGDLTWKTTVPFSAGAPTARVTAS